MYSTALEIQESYHYDDMLQSFVYLHHSNLICVRNRLERDTSVQEFIIELVELIIFSTIPNGVLKEKVTSERTVLVCTCRQIT